MTGADDTASVEVAYRAGATDFIAKPVNWALLGHRAHFILRAARALSELGAAIARSKQAEADLLRSQSQLASTLKAVPDLLFEIGLDGRYYSAHSPRTDLMATPPEEFLNKKVSDILPAAAASICMQAIAEAHKNGFSGGRCFELELGGKAKWFELSVSRKDDLSQDDPRFVVLSRDITERKLAEKKLRLAASVFSHAREGILITDAKGLIVEVNDTFTDITGYTREEVLGKNPNLLQSGRHSSAFYAEMWETITTTGNWHGEIWNRRKNGEVYADLRTISAVRDDSGNTLNYVALFIDITPMKEHQRQLERIAHYDALTALPNRVLLADRMQQAMLHSQRRNNALAVAYLDLDGFKAVNDTYGHNVGDDLLIALTARMKAVLRDGDTLARIGGDEFVAVLVDIAQVKDCEMVLERLLKAASDPLLVDNIQLQVSASIGVTMYPQDAVDVDLLMRHADQSMYMAKQAGKNRYQMFDVAQDAVMQTQKEHLTHIRLALDRHEFVLHYQPKVNMKSGKVVGAEALIRWQHPQRGLLAPGTFLPDIENHDLIIEVGEWVLSTVLAQMRVWHTQGLLLPISINVSARQLQDEGFATRVGELLAEYSDVQAQFLQFEILETSALQDIYKATAVMKACEALGIGFALDDFGTGYSSLAYLKHLPAKTLKIDQSFVRDMLEDPDDLVIINGMIGLARAFGRHVIAEGVETLAHGDLLQSIGCDLAQGFGIARPMSAASLPTWIANWSAQANWTA
ncbi:MAG: EAL domain-containing protein [Rhodoferax sp.]|nr:EAL domain-containing protein [Rhodoferax sp.]